MAKASRIHSFVTGRNMMAANAAIVAAMAASPLTMARANELHGMGIDIGTDAMLQEMIAYASQDAAPNLQPTVLTGSMATPVQFLQTWLPGHVNIVTQVQTIDEILGKVTAGDWEDEEVVQGVLEPTGLAQLYGDHTNIPLASWNVSYERRTIIRYEEGLRVGKLEEARAGKAKINDAATKRGAAAMALDIQRNRAGFYGFNGGNNRTYGFLNDPALPAYVSVSGGAWSTKTFLQITNDIRSWVGALVSQSGGLVRVRGENRTKLTLVLPLGADNYLSVTSDFGNSVQDWLDKTYPGMRVITAPELTNANGGANAVYLFAETVSGADIGDDGGQTFIQIVPASFKTVGVEQGAKAYVEDYSNATAGVLTKRPFLVYRASGI